MYCSQAEVINEFVGVIFDANSKVTDTTVDLFIASESNYIDSYIAAKYKVPVDPTNSPLSFELLKRICVFRVSDRIKRIIETKTSDPKLNQEVKGDNRTPVSDLNRIIDGKLRLIDCPLAGTDDGVSFGLIDPDYIPASRSRLQW